MSKVTRRYWAGGLLICATLAIWSVSEPVIAQDLQGKTIRIINPFAAGGTTDVVARLIAGQVSEEGKQSVVVETRVGAGSVVGSAQVARSAPDGTNILMVSNSFIINSLLRTDLPYETMRMQPLCMLVESTQVLVVNAASSYGAFNDFIDDARRRPNELNYASSGPATSQHIAGETLKRQAGISITYVSFQGGAPAVNALLGNHLTSVLTNYTEVKELIDAGKLRALAVGSRQRLKSLPDVPTIDELGYKDVVGTAFFGIVAPPNTPSAISDELIKTISTALNEPNVISSLEAQGLQVAQKCGSEFGSYLRDLRLTYEQAIRLTGIEVK
jgi:tripartite-type tricarboxylate transporter receptor subunit TctC